jgi:hypothetical protein
MTYTDALVNTIGSWAIGSLLVLLITGLGAIGVLGIPSAPIEVATGLTIAWFGLVIPLVSVLRAVQEERSARHMRPSYEQARARWERLYYCSRDDVVFMFDDGAFGRPERISEILFVSPFRP